MFLQNILPTTPTLNQHSHNQYFVPFHQSRIQDHSNAPSESHIFNQELVNYCWTYIRKIDKAVHSYFKQQLSKPAAYKTLAIVLYCKLRALIRRNSRLHRIEIQSDGKNSTTYTPATLHKYCMNVANKICCKLKKQDNKREELQTQVDSLRQQLNHIWIPLLLMGNYYGNIRQYMIFVNTADICMRY